MTVRTQRTRRTHTEVGKESQGEETGRTHKEILLLLLLLPSSPQVRLFCGRKISESQTNLICAEISGKEVYATTTTATTDDDDDDEANKTN